MVDLALFRQRAFVGVSLGTFAIGAGMFALLPYLTLYLQDVLGYAPLQGGLRMLPVMVFVFAIPLVSRRFTSSLPPGRVLATGLALTGSGLLLMERVSSGSHWTVLLPGMVVAGVGIGLANPTIATIALALVPPQRSGMASGISNTFRIGGLATGVAALGALLQSGIEHHLTSGGRALAARVAAAGTSAPGLSHEAARSAFVSGMHVILGAGGGLVLLGAAASLALIRPADVRRATPAAQTRSAPEPT
jgi:hypothetical protein